MGKFATIDTNGIFEKFKEKGVSLASRMAVTGARILRDEAKLRALVSNAKQDWQFNPASRGSQKDGTLSDSIYVANNKKLSDAVTVVYSVSWNEKKAFWGKFREFGYWRPMPPYIGSDGKWWSAENADYKKGVKGVGEWVPPQPFLAPAYEAKIGEVRIAMIARGQVELPKLLRGE